MFACYNMPILPPTRPQWLTYVGLCLHIVRCNAKDVGDWEIVETYLNSASKIYIKETFTSWDKMFGDHCNWIGPIDCPETSVRNYHCALRNNPEERSSRMCQCTSWRSAYQASTHNWLGGGRTAPTAHVDAPTAELQNIKYRNAKQPAKHVPHSPISTKCLCCTATVGSSWLLEMCVCAICLVRRYSELLR